MLNPSRYRRTPQGLDSEGTYVIGFRRRVIKLLEDGQSDPERLY